MIKRFLSILLVCCLLCGCSQEQIYKEHPSDPVSYFFPQDAVSQEYTVVFSGFSGESEQRNVTLSVTQVQYFKEGILYELKIDRDEEESDRYEESRENWWYIGSFFVQGEEIYFIRSNENQSEFPSVEEIHNRGTLVCNEGGKEDPLGDDEKGWHNISWWMETGENIMPTVI